MKATRLIILTFALFMGLGNAKAQEDYNKAQKAPQAKETVLNKSTHTQKGYNNYQNAYNAALREAKQAYPNKEVGIRNLSKGNVKINSDGSVSNYYNYTVVELPGIVAQNLVQRHQPSHARDRRRQPLRLGQAHHPRWPNGQGKDQRPNRGLPFGQGLQSGRQGTS